MYIVVAQLLLIYNGHSELLSDWGQIFHTYVTNRGDQYRGYCSVLHHEHHIISATDISIDSGYKRWRGEECQYCGYWLQSRFH